MKSKILLLLSALALGPVVDAVAAYKSKKVARAALGLRVERLVPVATVVLSQVPELPVEAVVMQARDQVRAMVNPAQHPVEVVVMQARDQARAMVNPATRRPVEPGMVALSRATVLMQATQRVAVIEVKQRMVAVE